jgi:hypothetical protein
VPTLIVVKDIEQMGGLDRYCGQAMRPGHVYAIATLP